AASPFRVRSEASPDKNAGLPDTTAGFTRSPFGHESFAVTCPLALSDLASHPVSVRRPVGSFPASSRRSLTVAPLRFPWVPVTKFPEDSHLQGSAHAGHARRGPGRRRSAGPPVAPMVGSVSLHSP